MHDAHTPHDSQDERAREPDGAHDGGYDLAPETPTPQQTPTRVPTSQPARQQAKREETRNAHDSAEHDSEESDGEESDGEEDGSLPPPISRAAHPSPWLTISGVALAVLLVSWLAGAPQLVLPESSTDGVAIIRELSFFERLEGIARTMVALPLATLGGVFGLLVLAFVRQRPVGDVPALFAKVAAIAALSMLLWLVPSEIRFLKQCLNVFGVPLVGGALAIPIFHLAPRDAFLAATYTLLGMMLLVFLAATVMWAVAG